MSNLWFLWFLQECHRNSWELKLAHRTLWAAKARKFDKGCLDFDRTVLDASVSRY
jgi:hypothetical protein